jgi:RNA polymerase sigma-70 factor, ECF subfamily
MDRELILQAQAVDMNAFNELIRRHDRQVLALASRYVDNAEDAKDIFQEVMIRIYRGLPSFQLQSAFATWVHRITVNTCLSHKRRQRGIQHVPLHEGADNDEGGREARAGLRTIDAGPDELASHAHLAAQVSRALQVLSPRQRMVFTLRHDEGRSLKEIAQTLRCTQGTGKRYLFTATRRMREQLADVLL